MGNATIQGQLWRVLAQDWVTYVEQVCLPLFGAAEVKAFLKTVHNRPSVKAGC
jgi:hypothetical protein